MSTDQVEQWLEFSKLVVNSASLASILNSIDKYLSLRSFLVGYSLSLADISIWGQLKGKTFAAVLLLFP